MFITFYDSLGYYIYNPHVNNVYQISSSLYTLLNQKCQDDILLKSSEYNMLNELGYLNNKPITIQRIGPELTKAFLERGIHNVVLQITQDCNLRCEYCPYTNNDGSERSHSKKYMKWDTAKASIDFIHEHSADSRSISFGFYGGEPLMNFPVIKQAVDYINEKFKGKRIKYMITTNATLLSEEILSFLDVNRFALVLSLDGPKNINDKHRRFENSNISTYEIVKKKIQIINNKYLNLKKALMISMVIDPDLPFFDYRCLFTEIPETRFITISSAIISDESLTRKNHYSEDYIKEYEYERFIFRFNNYLEYNNLLDQSYNSLFKSPLSREKMEIIEQIGSARRTTAPGGVCFPGYTKLFIDINGRFLPCEKVSEIYEQNILGNVKDGFDINKIVNLRNIPIVTKKECEKCWAFHLCSSCIRMCVSNEGIDRKRRINNCFSSKLNAINMLKEYVSLRRNGELYDD